VKRRLLNLLTVLSLVLCLATAVLWVRSRYRSDHIFAAPGHGIIVVMDSYDCQVELMLGCGWPANTDRWIVGSHDPRFMFAEIKPNLGYRRSGDKLNHWHSIGIDYYAGTFHSAVGADGTMYNMLNKDFASRIIPVPGRTILSKDWLLVWLFVLIPFARFMAWRRQSRRTGKNECPSCGYNLTSNVSGICPECGTPILSKART
jgi:DNA-directed RNA polymerase subunit RPC12/RpoP